MTKADLAKLRYDDLVPDPAVWRQLHVTSMTLFRWDRDPRLNFPKPIKINGRKYRSRSALDAWIREMAARGTVAAGAPPLKRRRTKATRQEAELL
jgi:hypothetical protein